MCKYNSHQNYPKTKNVLLSWLFDFAIKNECVQNDWYQLNVVSNWGANLDCGSGSKKCDFNQRLVKFSKTSDNDFLVAMPKIVTITKYWPATCHIFNVFLIDHISRLQRHLLNATGYRLLLPVPKITRHRIGNRDIRNHVLYCLHPWWHPHLLLRVNIPFLIDVMRKTLKNALFQILLPIVIFFCCSNHSYNCRLNTKIDKFLNFFYFFFVLMIIGKQ